jgi:hypothetical protein
MNWLTWAWNWLFGNSDSELIKEIRDEAVRLCGFLPTIETVAALIAVNPVVTTGFAIARRICQAVTKTYAASRVMGGDTLKPVVDGVVIEGHFVK